MVNKWCQCKAKMNMIAQARDEDDPPTQMHWCPVCGRLCITYMDIRGIEPDVDKWHEPTNAESVCLSCGNLIDEECRYGEELNPEFCAEWVGKDE